MRLALPEVDWRSHEDWTLPSQLKKIFEEAGEVAEAVANEDPVNTIRELLDTIQTCCTALEMVVDDWHMDLDRFQREHVDKLARKGYLKEGM